jgi:hypothetical protein
MTAQHEVGRRLAEHLRREAPDRAPTWVLESALEIIETTPQRRGLLRLPWRFPSMNPFARYATIAVTAVIVLAGAVALATGGHVPQIGGQIGASPTPSASPSPTPSPAPTASPAAVDPTSVADGLITAWNTGDAANASSLYAGLAPVLDFAIDTPVDGGAFTDEASTLAGIKTRMTAWQAGGSVLTRTGTVLTQGPYAVFPVKWTSTTGTYDGMELIRISTAGLVVQHLLFGVTSTTGTSATVNGTTLIDSLLTAQNGSDGNAASALFAATAKGFVFQDSMLVNVVPDKSHFVNAIGNGTATGESRTGNVLTQGRFLAFPFSAANGRGFQIIELDPTGKIQYIWHAIWSNLPATSPPASGG